MERDWRERQRRGIVQHRRGIGERLEILKRDRDEELYTIDEELERDWRGEELERD